MTVFTHARTRAVAMTLGAALIVAPAAALAISSPALAADFDPSTQFTTTLSAQVEVGEGPNAVAISPTGTTAYVSILDESAIAVVDIASGVRTGMISTGHNRPAELGLSPDGAYLYVGTSSAYSGVREGDALQRIDLASGTVVGTTAVKDTPQGVVVSPDGSTVYLAELGGTINKIDTATMTVTATVSLNQPNAHDVRLHPNGTSLYISSDGNHTGSSLFEVDLPSFSVLRAVPVGTQDQAGSFTMNAAGTRAYVSTDSNGSVVVIDLTTGETLQDIKGVGNMLMGIVLDPAETHLYAVSLGWGTIMTVDLETGKRVEVYREVGEGVYDLAMNPVTGDLISTDRWSNTVTLVERPSITDPADQHVELGENATFAATVRGIATPSWGGVQWQSSADGTEWTDVEGATGQELTVEATDATSGNYYRLAYTDRFWMADSSSAPARLTTPAVTGPEVTTPEVTDPEVTDPTVTDPEDSTLQVGSGNGSGDATGLATTGTGDVELLFAAATGALLLLGTGALLLARRGRARA